MSAKPTIAGILWVLLGVLMLFGVVGLAIFIFFTTADLYLLFSTAYALIIGIAFIAAGIGLLRRRKWSFKLGIVVPAIDIVLSLVLSALAFLAPATVPQGLQGTITRDVAYSAVGIVIELAGIALVLKSKGELVK